MSTNRRSRVDGAPFQPRDRVRVIGATDREIHDVTKFVGQIGIVRYLEYACGSGQRFPDDPMIGVSFRRGIVEEFWREELEARPRPRSPRSWRVGVNLRTETETVHIKSIEPAQRTALIEVPPYALSIRMRDASAKRDRIATDARRAAARTLDHGASGALHVRCHDWPSPFASSLCEVVLTTEETPLSCGWISIYNDDDPINSPDRDIDLVFRVERPLWTSLKRHARRRLALMPGTGGAR